MNSRQRDILKNLTEQQKEELRTFVKRCLVEAEIYYPQPDEGIVIDYNGELGKRMYSTISLKKRLEEIMMEIKND